MLIKRWDDEVDDLESTDSAMATAGFDVDGGHGFEGDAVAVEFEVAFAFEDDVDLDELFVVVDAGVDADVEEMDGSDAVGFVGEGAAGVAARTLDGGDLIELGDTVVGFRFDGWGGGRHERDCNEIRGGR